MKEDILTDGFAGLDGEFGTDKYFNVSPSSTGKMASIDSYLTLDSIDRDVRSGFERG